MREDGDLYVDKTKPIAQFLAGSETYQRAIFTRPRKFGKSLVLDIMAEMLRAGELPEGVPAWREYTPVDVEKMFGGLEVHDMLTRGDASLGDLFRCPRFVIQLDLGGVTTGSDTALSIINQLSDHAGLYFGPEAEASLVKLKDASTVGDVVRELISFVPKEIEVCILVDEYDAAILEDIGKERWDKAQEGLESLKSLLMITKNHLYGPRISHFIVTGVARFAIKSLFSGANNFTDFTYSEIVSKMFGFREDEIRKTFPLHLERMARNCNKTVDECVSDLALWYNNYCFDWKTSTFNPYAVLAVLDKGRLDETLLSEAANTKWLKVVQLALDLDSLLQHREVPKELAVDIDDIRTGNVNTVALLLQIGLLTYTVTPTDLPTSSHDIGCACPNEYARNTLRRIWNANLKVDITPLGKYIANGDEDKVEHLLKVGFESMSNLTSHGLEARESTYHGVLFGMLLASVDKSLGFLQNEEASRAGRSDLTIRFAAKDEKWIFELGLSASPDLTKAAEKKLEQAKQYIYSGGFTSGKVKLCAIVFKATKPASTSGPNPEPWLKFLWKTFAVDEKGDVT